jgi:hypothetical protein
LLYFLFVIWIYPLALRMIYPSVADNCYIT